MYDQNPKYDYEVLTKKKKSDLIRLIITLRASIVRWANQRNNLRADLNITKRQLELTKEKLVFCEDYMWKNHTYKPNYQNIGKGYMKSQASRRKSQQRRRIHLMGGIEK